MRPRALQRLLAVARAAGPPAPPRGSIGPHSTRAIASSPAPGPPQAHSNHGRWLDVQASKGESRAVLEAYQQLAQGPDFEPTARTENARLRALRQERRWAELVEAVRQWRPKAPRTLLTFHLAIAACGRLKDPEQAFRFFADAKRQVPGGPTRETYNLMMDAFSKSGRPADALRLFEV